jgi:hypothetical protein
MPGLTLPELAAKGQPVQALLLREEKRNQLDA